MVTGMTGTDKKHSYVIVVEPELEPDDARAFPGLHVMAHGGQTTISGSVADRKQLGEILGAITERNLMLVSIKRFEETPGDSERR